MGETGDGVSDGGASPMSGLDTEHAKEQLEEVARSVRASERRSRLDLDVRGLIGLIAVFGMFGIVFVQLFATNRVAIPAEVAGVVGAVIGFYFGSRPGNGKH